MLKIDKNQVQPSRKRPSQTLLPFQKLSKNRIKSYLPKLKIPQKSKRMPKICKLFQNPFQGPPKYLILKATRTLRHPKNQNNRLQILNLQPQNKCNNNKRSRQKIQISQLGEKQGSWLNKNLKVQINRIVEWQWQQPLSRCLYLYVLRAIAWSNLANPNTFRWQNSPILGLKIQQDKGRGRVVQRKRQNLLQAISIRRIDLVQILAWFKELRATFLTTRTLPTSSNSSP